MELRPYQEKVVNEIGYENAIVKMPTGSGKTFVAAEFLLRRLIKRDIDAIARSALFLVPTCDLVTQQTKAIKIINCNTSLIILHQLIVACCIDSSVFNLSVVSFTFSTR